MIPTRKPFQPYPQLSTTLAGATFNTLILYGVTSQCHIRGLALGALGSIAMNFSYKVMEDSSDPEHKTHSLHRRIIHPIASQLAEKTCSERKTQVSYSLAYNEFCIDTQLFLASVTSAVILGLLNHFVLNVRGMGFLGAFALSMVPALCARSVQIGYDWKTV